MKYLFYLFILFSISSAAQATLEFNKRFVECEDKWVAFRPGEDSSYQYGFIYIDEQAGLTFNYEGVFKISPAGKFVAKRLDSTSIKVRLEPNNVLVALIPAGKFKELQIMATPDWLKYYKTDTASAKRLFKWGYMYNGWDQCAKALTYLLRAKEINPHYEGLNVEIAFSYNCLNEFTKAEKILEEELKQDPSNAYVNKEYIYTITKTENIERATEQYHKSLTLVKDKTYNAENCFNILQFFYKKGDTTNFNLWYKELQKFPSDNRDIMKYADKMKEQMN
jgi:tetratricopeptide (TPR) repeat protein